MANERSMKTGPQQRRRRAAATSVGCHGTRSLTQRKQHLQCATARNQKRKITARSKSLPPLSLSPHVALAIFPAGTRRHRHPDTYTHSDRTGVYANYVRKWDRSQFHLSNWRTTNIHTDTQLTTRHVVGYCSLTRSCLFACVCVVRRWAPHYRAHISRAHATQNNIM